MTLAEFEAIYLELPHDVALFYSDVRRRFSLSHEAAYRETLEFARSIGCAARQPGLPPGPKNPLRLLLRKEL